MNINETNMEIEKKSSVDQDNEAQNQLNHFLVLASWNLKFIKECIANTIVIAQRPIDDIIKQLETKGYPKLSQDPTNSESIRSYQYLLNIDISAMTNEKVKELENAMELLEKQLQKQTMQKEIEQLVLTNGSILNTLMYLSRSSDKSIL